MGSSASGTTPVSSEPICNITDYDRKKREEEEDKKKADAI